MKKTIQELYCEHCDADTNQLVEESGHERDDSYDRFECLQCGWYKLGMSGEWENPNEEL